MNPFFILLLCALIAIAVVLLLPLEVYEKPEYTHQDVLLTNKNRVRCLPNIADISEKCRDIHLYDEKDVIKNKGFINDVIYRPHNDMSGLNFEHKLISNTLELNDFKCQNDSLPLSNINVHYLLTTNTSKLV